MKRKETNDDYILGIGACNVDIYQKALIKIRKKYDHPSVIKTSVGGVTANILRNASKLKVKTKLMTCLGKDPFSEMIIDTLKKDGIDTSLIKIDSKVKTGIFSQIQDENNDMYLAMCDMSAIKKISPSYLRKNKNALINASIIVIDPSLNDETIEELIKIVKNKVPIYVDPLSENYALKIKKYLPFIDVLKPNIKELESLTSLKIKNEKDIKKAIDILLQIGIKKIYLSQGRKGMIYADKNIYIKGESRELKKIVNASGAGDAAFGAILYGEINKFEPKEELILSSSAAISSLICEETVNPKLSLNYLRKIKKGVLIK